MLSFSHDLFGSTSIILYSIVYRPIIDTRICEYCLFDIYIVLHKAQITTVSL